MLGSAASKRYTENGAISRRTGNREAKCLQQSGGLEGTCGREPHEFRLLLNVQAYSQAARKGKSERCIVKKL